MFWRTALDILQWWWNALAMAIPDGIVVLILIVQNDDYCTVRYALLQSLLLMFDLIDLPCVPAQSFLNIYMIASEIRHRGPDMTS